jgi:hypothetical protein
VARGIEVRRRLTFLIVIVALCSQPSFADVNDNQQGTPGGSASGDTLTASVELHDAAGHVVAGYTPHGASGQPIVCYYFNFGSDGMGTVVIGYTDYDAGPVWPPEAGQIYVLECRRGTSVVSADLVEYDPGNPLGPVDLELRATDAALDKVHLPTPTLAVAPPAATPQLVGKPSWFWLAMPWQPVQASAALGGVTSTVTATPTQTTWEPGDGSPTVTCDGPGTPWHEGVDSSQPPCGHTYTTRGAYTLSVTVSWQVTWASTTGAGGPLAPLTTTATLPLAAREAQAVIN